MQALNTLTTEIKKILGAEIKFKSPAMQLTVPTGTATTLAQMTGFASTGFPDGYNYALLEVEDAGTDGIRFWETGDAPTSTVGIRRANKDIFDLEGKQSIDNFKAITVGTVKLNIQFGVKS